MYCKELTNGSDSHICARTFGYCVIFIHLWLAAKANFSVGSVSCQWVSLNLGNRNQGVCIHPVGQLLQNTGSSKKKTSKYFFRIF